MKATGAVPRALLAGLLTLLALLALLAPTRALPAGPVRPAGAKPDPSRENDIDFEGQVTSGEQTASSTPEMVAMVNRARGAAVDAEETIVEVQRILDKYPQLPRLSRGDILSILDNITRSAEAATTTSNPGDFTSSDTTAATTEDSATTLASSAEQGPDRQEHGRELMVVLPFNAKNLSETNIKELYTKRPLTHIIGDPTTTTKEKPTWPQRRRPAPTTAVPEPELGHELGPVYKVTEELESDAPPPEVFVSQRVKSPEKKRPLYAEQLDSERRRTPAVSTTPAPELAEDDVDYTTKRRRPESTRRPWRGTRRTTATPPTSSTSTAASQSEAVPSNHKPYYTEPTVKPWRVTTVPTTKKPIKHKPDHNLEPNKKLSTSGWTPVPVEPTKESKWKANPAPVRGTPLHDMKKAMLPATTMRPMMREDVKDLLASIGLKTGALPPKRSTLAPLSTTTTTTTTVAPVPDAADAAESLTPEMKDILMSIGLLPGKEVPVAQPSPGGVMPAMPTITTQPVVPEVDPSSYVQFKPLPIASTRDEAPHQVSEDMHEFLASFGLVPAIQSARIVSSPDEYLNMDDLSSARRSKALQESSTEDSVGNAASPEATPEMIPVEPETDPDNISYAELGNDDPLPTAASLSASLEPAAQPSGVPDVDSEALSLPPDMKQVLDSLGLPRQPKRIDSPSRGNLHSRDHIFNPVVHSAKLDDRREAEKVIKLLSSIRVLPIGPNGTQIIPEAVLAELTSSGSITTPKYGFRKKEKPGKKQETRLEDSGPNPLSTDELRLYLETAKNEVKRQEAASSSASSSSASSSAASDASSATAYDDNAAELPTTSSETDSPSETTPASSSTTTTSTTTTTTTTEAPTANLDDLAESFGGDGDRPKNSGPVDTLPPARPNGLYFLFDWNTFLNVGEEGKNPVRLNFMPRIGDPKRFIEVKVP